jgi:hypothetical protein
MPSMVYVMTTIPSIPIIFARYNNKRYTRDALLYQDILRYSVKELEPSVDYSFKLWDITDWLLSNNLEMANDYLKSSSSHMTKTNKIQARIGRVRRHINSLLYLGLLSEYTHTKQSRGHGTTPEYRYTEFGLLIALLVKALVPEKRQKAIRFIYKLFCKNYENNPSSLDRFCLALTNKLVKNNLFEHFIDGILQSMERNIPFSNLEDLFDHAVINEFDEKDSKRYLELRKEAFNELDPDMKKYFMHIQKLEIERKMFGIANNIKGFEKMVFDLRNDYEKVAAEGYCKYCQLYFPLAFSLLDYVELANFVDNMAITCPECKNNEAIAVPAFRV